jgi:hypothetical protein
MGSPECRRSRRDGAERCGRHEPVAGTRVGGLIPTNETTGAFRPAVRHGQT